MSIRLLYERADSLLSLRLLEQQIRDICGENFLDYNSLNEDIRSSNKPYDILIKKAIYPVFNHCLNHDYNLLKSKDLETGKVKYIPLIHNMFDDTSRMKLGPSFKLKAESLFGFLDVTGISFSISGIEYKKENFNHLAPDQQISELIIISNSMLGEFIKKERFDLITSMLTIGVYHSAIDSLLPDDLPKIEDVKSLYNEVVDKLAADLGKNSSDIKNALCFSPNFMETVKGNAFLNNLSDPAYEEFDKRVDTKAKLAIVKEKNQRNMENPYFNEFIKNLVYNNKSHSYFVR